MRTVFKGVGIEIDYYFIAMLTLMTVVFKNESILLCFLFCILHELGHLFAMLAVGQNIRKIVFGYFGVRIECADSALSVRHEIIIAAAGPLINLVLAVIFGLLKIKSAQSMNLSLLIFNLLPVKMLDGGRILSHFFGYGFLKAVGTVMGVILTVLGIGIIYVTKSNFVFLIVSVYILLGTMK